MMTTTNREEVEEVIKEVVSREQKIPKPIMDKAEVD